MTYVGKTRKVWSGAGWTGQPTIARDRGRIYLIIGGYDRHLRKIDFETNQEVWKYKFDDVIKGSASIYLDETASEDNQIVILQGSRTGRPKKGIAPSFRAISFRTGRELWKLNIRKTASYSQDNDSSALDLGNGVIFNAGENGIGYFLDYRTKTAQKNRVFCNQKFCPKLNFIILPTSNIREKTSSAKLRPRASITAFLLPQVPDIFMELTLTIAKLSGIFTRVLTWMEPWQFPKIINSFVR